MQALLACHSRRHRPRSCSPCSASGLHKGKPGLGLQMPTECETFPSNDASPMPPLPRAMAEDRPDKSDSTSQGRRGNRAYDMSPVAQLCSKLPPHPQRIHCIGARPVAPKNWVAPITPAKTSAHSTGVRLAIQAHTHLCRSSRGMTLHGNVACPKRHMTPPRNRDNVKANVHAAHAPGNQREHISHGGRCQGAHMRASRKLVLVMPRTPRVGRGGLMLPELQRWGANNARMSKRSECP